MSTASSLFLAAINILQSKTESSKYYKCSRAFDVLKKHGIKVPHEISLSGFDNTDQSQCNAVPLTTVQQPHKEMVYSLDLVFQQIYLYQIDQAQALLHPPYHT